MSTRISGRQSAARITAVVAASSVAVAGVGFLALEQTTPSSASIPTSSVSQNGESSQTPARSEKPDSSSAERTTENDDSVAIPQPKKAVVRQQSKSAVIPVSPGNSGPVSGQTSGS